MNNTKFFADVYYLKRAQLLSEYLTGNLEKIDEFYKIKQSTPSIGYKVQNGWG